MHRRLVEWCGYHCVDKPCSLRVAGMKDIFTAVSVQVSCCQLSHRVSVQAINPRSTMVKYARFITTIGGM